MNQNSDPIDYLIQCCESQLNTGQSKITKFTILNAKDQLRKLRESFEIYTAVAWATVNDRGDIYNLTLHYNRFQDENTLISLYSNKKEFQEKYGKLSKSTI